MDPLITNYVEMSFTEEMINVIYKAFNLFSKYNYVDYEEDYINLLMSSEELGNSVTKAKFIQFLQGQIEYILSSHLISLVQHSTIPESVAIMEFLYDVQDLHDYTQLAVTLNSSLDPYECFAKAVHDHTSMDEHRVMEIVDRLDPVMFTTLHTYVEKKLKYRNAELPRYTDIGREIISNMRAFKEHTKKEHLVGITLLDAGVLLDQDINRYSSYIGTSLNDLEVIDFAYNILSVIYLTKQGIDRPVEVYRNIIGIFIGDLTYIAQVENSLNTILADYNNFKEVENEKIRISKTSHSSSII